MIEAALFTVAVLLFLAAGYFYLGYRAEKREWKKQMASLYEKEEKRSSFIVVLGTRFDESRYAEPIQKRLKRANVGLTPSEYLGFLLVGMMAGVYLFNNFLNIGFPLNLLLSAGLLFMLQLLFFFLRKNKQQERMNDQLPEVCRILANATRTGMTLTQGLALVAQEIPEPAKSEFQRVVSEMRFGTDFDKALRNLEQRVPSREYKLFVAMLLIQKKAGGNLYSILSDMGTTLDERKLLQQEIKTMTAEQRYVSYMLPFIPVFLLLMMNKIVDGFLDPLFKPIGMILGLFFLLGIALTIFLVRKVTNIRV
ncbi:membrane protein [Paenibacillus sp. J31TS4]|uniref:type II secretion system F family protein n=1 Tax=Paenibacillus sp. J31TS4 TaxID=2807195 RepID=UPI001B04A2FC|nr:type II secretion system F family protein [Paenibacillus sp. J31TS4]GIP41199.1 membrane protein [Paenibacillus sp. J31TS4]